MIKNSRRIYLAWGTGACLLSALSLSAGCGGSTTGAPGGESGSGGAGGSGAGGSGAQGGSGARSGGQGGSGAAGSGAQAGSGAGGSGAQAGSGAGGSGAQVGGGGAGGQEIACSQPSDCVVVPNSCCGRCGVAARGDAQAVRADRAADVAAAACEGGVGCPDCAAQPDPTLVATCVQGSCKAVDLLDHPSTTCQSEADCQLRTNECCECPGPSPVGMDHLIAVSSKGSLALLVCDQSVACDACEPQFPRDATTVCIDGHCQVTWYIDAER